MGSLALTLPTIGQPNSTEDVKIVNALTATQTFLNGANLDTTNIAAGPTLISTQQAWQTIVCTNFANISYYKDSLGTVHFRGENNTTTGAINPSTTLFTMPAGFRPGTTISLAAYLTDSASGGSNFSFTMTTAGLTVSSSSTTWPTARVYSFGNCHYRAEN